MAGVWQPGPKTLHSEKNKLCIQNTISHETTFDTNDILLILFGFYSHVCYARFSPYPINESEYLNYVSKLWFFLFFGLYLVNRLGKYCTGLTQI